MHGEYMRIETASEVVASTVRAYGGTSSYASLWTWAGADCFTDSKTHRNSEAPETFKELVLSYLAAVDEHTPQWVAVLGMTLMKTCATAYAFELIRVSVAWRVWVCFLVSFWLERNPRPRVEITDDLLLAVSERRRLAWEYRGRMLLFSIVAMGTLWVLQLQQALSRWYQVLVAFTAVSVLRLFISMRRFTTTGWAAMYWSARIGLAALLHTTFACFAVSRLASADQRGQLWLWIAVEFVVYATGRYALRLAVAYLMVGAVMKHPFLIRRFCTVVTDMGLLTGLYCLGDLELIAILACLLVIVDGVAVTLLSREAIPFRLIHDNTSTLWLHLLAITVALPVDLLRGGLLAWYQRSLVCLSVASGTMIVQLWLCAHMSVALTRLMPLRSYGISLSVEKHSEWALQIASTAFAIIGTLYATQSTRRQ